MPRTLTIDLTARARYIHLPVKNGGQRVKAQIKRDEQVVREFVIELATAEPVDWWAFYDLSAFAGQDLRLELSPYHPKGQESEEGGHREPIPEADAAWIAQAIQQGDELLDTEDLYNERYRPQFHFTSRRGWNNDPNGMVYHDGEWHLFYQHNPFGTAWGNMHWGHAVSRDLVHWQELDEALYQRSLEDMAFSGGGLVDHQNSAGFQQGTEPPLVVAFTSTGRGECLAFSNDNGRTLAEWTGNPFLAHRGRDPKIIWLEAARKWVMIVYEELEGGSEPERGYAIYDSTDLKHWQRHSFLPGWFECPELFRLTVDGDPDHQRWVIYGCRWEGPRSSCLIGDFDGQRFNTSEENEVSHFGPNFYAAQIFSDAPDGRVIMIGWLAGADYPGMPFSQGMTVPLELSLRSTSGGTRLCFYPVREVAALRETTAAGKNLSLTEANQLLAKGGELLDVELEVRAEGQLKLDIRGYPLTYDPAAREISFAGSQASLPPSDGPLALRVLVDRSVTEVFVENGLAAFSAMTLFDDPNQPLRLSGQGSAAQIKIHNLRSIWEDGHE